MIDLKKNTLLREVPQNLLHDSKVENMVKILEPSLKQRTEWIEKINYTLNLHELDDEILDHLLWEKRMGWFAGLSSSSTREEKIKLIESAIEIHRTKGTPYAVELLINILFGDGTVEEWFEYGGEPYTFRVLTTNPAATNEKALQFINAVNYVKNARSHLENVILIQTEQTNLYWGGVVHEGNYELYRQVT